MDYIGWALTANSIVGAILNARKRIEGFYVWTIGNAGWVIWALYHKIYPQAVLFAVYLGITIYGIYKWQVKVEEVNDYLKKML